jgi:hypothetical protein
MASGPKSAKPTPFPLYGMPMTYLLDREARSVGYLVGEADWTSRRGWNCCASMGGPRADRTVFWSGSNHPEKFSRHL